MRITEAARALGMSPRMVRYRERLGLVPRHRVPGRRRNTRAHQANPSSANPTSTNLPSANPTSADPSTNLPNANPTSANPTGPSHRRYTDEDLRVIALGVRLEETYGISPAALSFAVRALTEPKVGAAVRELAELLGRIPSPPSQADLDRERALQWLGRSGVLPPPRPVRGR
ncbi:MerR family transcriptional regulator [Actinopolymorpha alba]|uniref:MerR family transcriptional regulator n=1 Tax=Actinopolymorpha alba TaxID=533267 RepID=UPI0004762531|nr:MerR family transcriptional regulator [Actinopolymorpha alba]